MVGLDQISKNIIVSKFSLNESITVIKDFFNITYVQNFGAGFSILQNQTSIFYLISIFALIFLGYLLYKSKKNEIINRISYLLIIGGTLGNLYDRITHKYVIDFLDFYIFGYNFPVFNVADMFITVGCFILIFSILLENKNAKD